MIRLLVLHHAAEPDLYGQRTFEQLAHHGYRIGFGTPCPMLHAMERMGYVGSRVERAGPSQRRIHRAKPIRMQALTRAHEKIRELFREVAPRIPDA